MAEVQVGVEGLYLAPGGVLAVLKELDGERTLSIFIGPFEAQAIMMAVQGTRPERPMTHDLFAATIDLLDAKLEKVVVTELKVQTYYAVAYFKKGNDSPRIDCRPSDGIALCVRTPQSQLFVEESLLLGGGGGKEGLDPKKMTDEDWEKVVKDLDDKLFGSKTPNLP